MSEDLANATTANPLARLDLLIAGERIAGRGEPFRVLDKFTQTPVAEATEADPGQVQQMLDAAEAAFRAGAPSAYARGAILDRAARLLSEQAEEVQRIIQLETGFTRADARGELRRCLETLRLSAEEARGLRGEVVPVSGAPNQGRRMAFTLRVPLGVVLAITPFNSPLNTVAHKVAPAFAAGNAVVVKPASATPMTALKLAGILVEAGLPPGFLSVLLGGADVTQAAIADPRVRFIAFTGSTAVGGKIQAAAGLRRTQMELGSIAFTILCDDAVVEDAVPKLVGASFRKAGQVCTSVQIALIHRSRFAETVELLKAQVERVRHGDPSDDGVLTGPLISEAEACRVESWIEEAIAQGATRLAGGPRNGAVVPPTLLTDVTPEMKVYSEEIFGPVLCLIPFDSQDEAVRIVNSTPYGLATGIFTNQLTLAMDFARRLEVGGVHINETSSSRVDLMPYGGTKDSGFGREGPKYAVEEMTEQRIVTITT
ncbi:aldehyde dehydrogenase family protein [Tropicimonas marinistellae]|uniref:aldehyde dehydrogenase family protein n=1 Tax=Tropicimonas marinistellae TaxID=1739787 RepID=UPI00082B4080|nr:aldehyde dehydrogenase family protein [Tropicimonas marinistellae]